jgi:manganese transport protein
MSDQDPGRGAAAPSLKQVHGSVAVPKQLSFWRRLFAFSGPAYLVSAGKGVHVRS